MTLLNFRFASILEIKDDLISLKMQLKFHSFQPCKSCIWPTERGCVNGDWELEIIVLFRLHFVLLVDRDYGKDHQKFQVLSLLTCQRFKILKKVSLSKQVQNQFYKRKVYMSVSPKI